MQVSSRAIYPLYALSGFVSLAYQVAWFRIFADQFGATGLTFGLVVSNFLGGLAAGSLASRPLTRWMSRLTRLKSPLRLYGAVEVLVAGAALLTLLIPLIPADLWGSFPYYLEGDIYRPIAVYRAASFGIAILCIFLPCFLMGVTFPLLCDAFRHDARFPSMLYGWNTLGACSAVLVCEFFLLPLVGHSRTLASMIAVNFALGAFFVVMGAGGAVDGAVGPREERAAPPGAAPATPSAPPSQQRRRPMDIPVYPFSVALALAVVGGLLTGAFEADVFRRLQFLNCRTGVAMSFISFWAILAIFLASWTVRAVPGLRLSWIKLGYVLALAVYLVVWRSAYPLRDRVNAGDLERLGESLPPGQTSAQFFEFGYSAAPLLLYTGVFVFPAFYLLSLLLPHVCNAVQAERRHLGLVYGANTLAFCVGILGFTVVTPQVSVFYSLKLFLGLFALLVVLLLAIGTARRLPVWKPAGAGVLFAAMAALVPASFDVSYYPAGSPPTQHPVRAMKSNIAHTTFIVGDPTGDLLFFDSHPMSGTNTTAQQYMRLMAHFPLLAHPGPSEALLICFGVGSTASAIATHETIERIDVVDLNRQVFATAPEFAHVNHDVARDPRVRLIHDDGRRFLSVTDRTYDLITSEPPPPMFSGMERLYSREYYEAAREHLTPGGMMTQWLPIGQMPAETVDEAVATFVHVFPESLLFVGAGTNYILVGSTAPIDLAVIERRFGESDAAADDMMAFTISSPAGLLARIVKGGPTLRREFGGFPLISDQNNSFSHAFHDPANPALITYDPVAMLEEIDAGQLAAHEELRETVLHLGRLKTRVLDFPEAALMSIPPESAPHVELSDADWHTIRARFTASFTAGRTDPSRAITHLQQALLLERELPYVAKRLGLLLTQAQRHDEAVRAWRIVQEVEPDDPEGHFGAGWSLVRLGRYDESIAALRRAIELDDRGVSSYRSSLGDAYALVRRWSDAVTAYDEALALDPNNQMAIRNREACLQQLER